MKDVEIERKFLLRPCLPKHFLEAKGIKYRRFVLQQYYLAPANGEYIRYRRSDNHFYKTIKNGEGIVREEREYPVDMEEFETHLPSHTGKIIKKKRYVFDYKNVTYEMDRFRKSLNGLCFLEVEFDDLDSAMAYRLPDIFSHLLIAEVTDDARFNNASLSKSAFIPSLHFDQNNLFDFASPFESTHLAVEKMLAALMEKVEQNRTLLCSKNSAEALHRFRVSIRKLRSFLSLFKECFVSEWIEQQRKNLSELMTQTNTKRDIDVLLGRMNNYKSHIPKTLRKDSVAVEALIREELEKIDNSLDGFAESQMLIEQISEMKRPQILEFSPNERVSQPIIITAIEILRNLIDKITKKGERIQNASQTEVAVYHNLRIEFKNLRYFIEIMKPFIQQNRYDETIDMFKGIQDVLGDFHDYSIQHTRFVSMLQEASLQDSDRRKTIELFLAEVHERERHQEVLFAEEFRRFLKLKKRIKQLFFYI